MGCNTSKQLEVEVNPKVKNDLPIHSDAPEDALDPVGVAVEKEDLPVAVVVAEAAVEEVVVMELPHAAEEKAEIPMPIAEPTTTFDATREVQEQMHKVRRARFEQEQGALAASATESPKALPVEMPERSVEKPKSTKPTLMKRISSRFTKKLHSSDGALKASPKPTAEEEANLALATALVKSALDQALKLSDVGTLLQPDAPQNAEVAAPAAAGAPAKKATRPSLMKRLSSKMSRSSRSSQKGAEQDPDLALATSVIASAVAIALAETASE